MKSVGTQTSYGQAKIHLGWSRQRNTPNGLFSLHILIGIVLIRKLSGDEKD